MNERKWLTITNPEPMLEFLRDRGSERRLRLFACACCRRIWHLFRPEESFQQLVEMIERFADGTDQKEEFVAWREKAFEEIRLLEERGEDSPGESNARPRTRFDVAQSIASYVGTLLEDTTYDFRDDTFVQDRRQIVQRTMDVAKYAALAAGHAALMGKEGRDYERAAAPERQQQADLLRCIFGNPFRPVSLDPSWRTPTVMALAQSIYAERRFEDLPILADALEEAGCTQPDLLGHCRSAGAHARGCWAIDLLRRNP